MGGTETEAEAVRPWLLALGEVVAVAPDARWGDLSELLSVDEDGHRARGRVRRSLARERIRMREAAVRRARREER